jgi:protein arginine kinase activator
MQCCVCKKKPATVHLTQIAQDKVHKIDLCEDCAKKQGINDPAGFLLADKLLGLGAAQEMEQAVGGEELSCPVCGFTQADFKKAGRLGCAACYDTFAEGLEGLLKSMHKGIRHIGKSPTGQPARVDVAERIKQLSKELEQAVAEENFEAAAAIRDQLKEIRAQASQPPSPSAP